MKIIFVDLSTRLETVRDLEIKARGGMVSSLFTLSDLLQDMGNEVWIASDIQTSGQTLAGVNWVRRVEPTEKFDWLICNRGVGNGYPEINAKNRCLWTHDLPHNGFIYDPAIMSAFKLTVFMSDYAERVWRGFFQTIGKSVKIPNGVDKSKFYPEDRDWYKIIFASAPNRGLKRLPLLYESIKGKHPRVTLNAYSNMSKMHPNEIREEEINFFDLDYKSCQEAGINLSDPLPQNEFAKELRTSGMMLMPSDYPEICSNNILQALACGVPVVTTGGLGSAEEWVRHRKNGMLTEFMPVDYMVYQMQLVRLMDEVFSNYPLHLKLSRGAAKTPVLTWEDVAWKWNKSLRRFA